MICSLTFELGTKIFCQRGAPAVPQWTRWGAPRYICFFYWRFRGVLRCPYFSFCEQRLYLVLGPNLGPSVIRPLGAPGTTSLSSNWAQTPQKGHQFTVSFFYLLVYYNIKEASFSNN